MKREFSTWKRQRFGHHLLKLRKHNGYTVREVGAFIGLPYGTYAKMERGEHVKIKVEAVEKLEKLYQIDNDYLHTLCERIPQDVFYKLVDHPGLLTNIINMEV